MEQAGARGSKRKKPHPFILSSEICKLLLRVWDDGQELRAPGQVTVSNNGHNSAQRSNSLDLRV
eukprot:3933211-Rhodomonas_salina.1